MVDPTTTHLHLNLPQPADSMADVTNGFNNAWTTISGAPKPKASIAGPTNPTSGYNVGDVVYNQAWKSAFILIATDANWGYFWRPIQAKFSPWVAPGNAILSDAVNYAMAAEGPVAYRIYNDGVIEFTGGIKKVSGALPNGFNTWLTQMPVGVHPEKFIQWDVCMYKSGWFGTSYNGNYYCKVWLTNSLGTWNFNTFNNANGAGAGATADADTIVFNQAVKYQIAQRTDI